eukprot:scaffold277_cov93-Skeletonema_dohrnii-CCMP3373.AAC.1
MHYIQQTVIGPICTSPGCQCTVSNKTRLFSCSANTINAHWKAKKCFNGKPSVRGVHTQLRERLRYLHTTSIGNNDIAFQHFRVGDEGVTRRMQYHCSHCGLVDKPTRLLRQHCRPPMSDEVEGRKWKCPGTPVNDYVLKNKYNQMVPESFLMAMVAGDSPLRRLQPDLLLVPQTIPPPPSPSPPTPVGVQQHIAAATPPTSSTLSRPKKRIKVSPRQLSEVTSPQYMPPTGRHRIVIEQIRLLDHVGAENHYDFFLHICLGTGNLTQRLLAMALTYRTPFDPDRDDPHLKVMLRAADL